MIVDLLQRHAGKAFLAAVALTVAVLPLLPSLGVDNSLEVWLDQDGTAYRDYRAFVERFGNEEFILVIYALPSGVDHDLLMRLTDLRFELEEVDGVRRVEDLATFYGQFYSQRGLDAFRRDLSSWRYLLISEDGRRGATWVHLDDVPGLRRVAIAARVEAAARAWSEDVYLAGSPILSLALDRESQSSARKLFPLVFLLSAVVLALVFRDLRRVAVPFAAVGPGLLWTLGLLHLSGARLNMVTVALPPLVWVLGLSTSIHLLARHDDHLRSGTPPEDAARRALGDVLRPCALSAVTTALGFLALVTASMAPVREMGLFTAAGILFCLASNVLVFPWLARFLPARPRGRRTLAGVTLLARTVERRPGTILALALALTLVVGAGVLRIKADSNPIDFFREDAPISRTYREILPALTGPYSLEIELTKEPDPDVFRRLEELARSLEARPDVARVLSAADWKEIDDLPSAFAADGRLRVSVLAWPMGSLEHRRLIDAVTVELNGFADWEPRLTGLVPLLVEMQDRLVRSQLESFGLAFALIGAVLGVLLRRPSYALLSAFPNVLPILFALGLMGWAGVSLNPATIMIAAVALGIAVDDTIHVLEAFRLGRAREDANAAVRVALTSVGRPLVVTSAVAGLGFLALTASEFVPLAFFGLLTAIALAAALVGDLVVLPALLVKTRLR